MSTNKIWQFHSEWLAIVDSQMGKIFASVFASAFAIFSRIVVLNFAIAKLHNFSAFIGMQLPIMRSLKIQFYFFALLRSNRRLFSTRVCNNGSNEKSQRYCAMKVSHTWKLVVLCVTVCGNCWKGIGKPTEVTITFKIDWTRILQVENCPFAPWTQ